MKPMPLVAEALVETIAAAARLHAAVRALSPEQAARVKQAIQGVEYARDQLIAVVDQALATGVER